MREWLQNKGWLLKSKQKLMHKLNLWNKELKGLNKIMNMLLKWRDTIIKNMTNLDMLSQMNIENKWEKFIITSLNQVQILMIFISLQLLVLKINLNMKKEELQILTFLMQKDLDLVNLKETQLKYRMIKVLWILITRKQWLTLETYQLLIPLNLNTINSTTLQYKKRFKKDIIHTMIVLLQVKGNITCLKMILNLKMI